MNVFRIGYCRTFQAVTFLFQRFLSIKEPPLLSEEHATLKVGSCLKDKKLTNALVVTGPSIYRLGLLDDLIKGLDECGIRFTVFTDVKSNPTVKNVEEGLSVYEENGCDCVIALGGGSPIDCAKMIAARASNHRPTEKLRGLLKITHKTPFLAAVPTTAGSGSECTLAAVISNDETGDKYAISDPHLIPSLAVHDPNLFLKLPPKVTSTTGMDALTHAVEAYVGRSNTKRTKKCALEAIKLIYENLLETYVNPENLEARKKMQKASYLAGIAFTNAYVGYVHALAHALGGKYDTPHGLANAVLLPNVLEAYGEKIYKKCGEIVTYLGISSCSGDKEKTEWFIASVREINQRMDIPSRLDIDPDEKALEELARHAYKEANPLYPVPKELDIDDLKAIYAKSLKEKTL